MKTYTVSIYWNHPDYQDDDQYLQEQNTGLFLSTAKNEVKNARSWYPNSIIQITDEQSGIIIEDHQP